MYANCGMYLTSAQYGGLQMGGHMVRLTMTWTNVPTESMTIPVPVEVLESTYMVTAPSTYAPHEDVTVIDGAVIVTINEVIPEYTLTINYVDANGNVMAPAYTATMEEGSSYSVASPVIDGYMAIPATVTGTLTEDTTVTVTYYPVSHQLRIYYLSDETDMALTSAYIANVPYGEAYSVASPEISGWHLVDESQAVISGVMPNYDVEVDVYYTRNTVTYNFYLNDELYDTVTVYEGETPDMPAYTAPEGYTFSGWELGDGNNYYGYTTINSYTVTVHYVYEDGTTALDDVVLTVNYGEAYNVVTPEIEGYEYDIDLVAGTMGTENVEVTVTYTLIPVAEFVWGDADCDGDCDWADVSALALWLSGEGELTAQGIINANVGNSNPFVDPYDMSAIDDETNWSDLTYIALYLSGELQPGSVEPTEEYTLTINYIYADGTTAQPTYTATLEEGSAYSVTSPAITGYTPDIAVVAGNITEDTTVTVTYNPNQYTISYYVDGELYTTQTYAYGETVVAPTYTPATGYDNKIHDPCGKGQAGSFERQPQKARSCRQRHLRAGGEPSAQAVRFHPPDEEAVLRRQIQEEERLLRVLIKQPLSAIRAVWINNH